MELNNFVSSKSEKRRFRNEKGEDENFFSDLNFAIVQLLEICQTVPKLHLFYKQFI